MNDFDDYYDETLREEAAERAGIHPAANPETGECGDLSCPCHEFALKTPLEASSGGEMAFDLQTVKTAPTPASASGITLPIPTFTSDWDTAPRSRRARVEMEDAAYWYAMGQRAKDIEWKLAWNQELRALACMARERVAG